VELESKRPQEEDVDSSQSDQHLHLQPLGFKEDSSLRPTSWQLLQPSSLSPLLKQPNEPFEIFRSKETS